MTRLPTGTVTFLFTDIEGSTRMVQELGGGFLDVLETHNRLLRSAFERGVEVRMEGDAFFVAFSSAADAIRAAIAGQRALERHRWPGEIRMSVRMGIHTGVGTLGGTDYVGVDVHRAARISAAGHGGQILVSEATLAAANGAPDVEVRRLGTHRFKDLDEPIEIFQVAADDLGSDFPAIRSIGAPPTNLPSQTSSFVGRSREIGELLDLLEVSGVLTLIGPGGVGKTRLALDVAARALHRFADGVFFVPLETLSDPALVPLSIAEKVGARLDGGADPVDALATHVADRETLLVLDNFEHVVAAARVVTRLRAAAPGLTVVITSQEVLRIAGEVVFPVRPLPLPWSGGGTLDTLLQSDAAALFVERARAAGATTDFSDADIDAISQIVTELDGLPLALELAAARLRVLALEDLRSRLGDRFRTLRGGNRDAPERHRTLSATIEWSHDLLDEAEQRALAQFSVMIGGFTLEMAEAVIDPELSPGAVDLVDSLMDKSLLRRSTVDGVTRFSMLRSIREFASTRLAATAGADAVNERLAHQLLALAVEAMPHLESEGQSPWLDRLTLEHDNIRAIIAWSLSGGDVDLGLELASSIWRFHHRRGHLPEARRDLEALLALPGGSDRPRAVGLTGLASIVYWLGDFEQSIGHYLRALELFEALGETERAAFCLYGLSTAASLVGDIDAAVEYARRAEEAYRACGSEEGVRRVVPAVAFATWMSGHLEVAAEQWERAARLFRDAGDVAEELQTCVARAIVDFQLGRGGIAGRVRGCIEAMIEYGDVTGTLMALEFFARVIVTIEPETAVRIAGGSRRLRSEFGGGHTPETVGLTSTWEEAGRLIGDEQVAEAAGSGERLDLDPLVELARSVRLDPAEDPATGDA